MQSRQIDGWGYTSSYIVNKVSWGVVIGGVYTPLYSHSRKRRSVQSSTPSKTKLLRGGSVAKAFRIVGEAAASRFWCTWTMSSPASDVSKAVLSSGDSSRHAGRTSPIVGDWKSLHAHELLSRYLKGLTYVSLSRRDHSILVDRKILEMTCIRNGSASWSRHGFLYHPFRMAVQREFQRQSDYIKCTSRRQLTLHSSGFPSNLHGNRSRWPLL